jgi:hypothetical protein
VEHRRRPREACGADPAAARGTLDTPFRSTATLPGFFASGETEKRFFGLPDFRQGSPG